MVEELPASIVIPVWRDEVSLSGLLHALGAQWSREVHREITEFREKNFLPDLPGLPVMSDRCFYFDSCPRTAPAGKSALCTLT
jgi:hypothetical protein